jgi:hypothetical protein
MIYSAQYNFLSLVELTALNRNLSEREKCLGSLGFRFLQGLLYFWSLGNWYAV